MKNALQIIGLMVLLAASAVFADEVADLVNTLGLPAWAKNLVLVTLGAGPFGAVAAILFKVVRNARSIIKKLLKLVERIKPIIQDAETVRLYNEIVDEIETLFNELKLVKTQDFLEKIKIIPRIDRKKIMKAVSLNPIVKAANEALK